MMAYLGFRDVDPKSMQHFLQLPHIDAPAFVFVKMPEAFSQLVWTNGNLGAELHACVTYLSLYKIP